MIRVGRHGKGSRLQPRASPGTRRGPCLRGNADTAATSTDRTGHKPGFGVLRIPRSAGVTSSTERQVMQSTRTTHLTGSLLLDIAGRTLTTPDPGALHDQSVHAPPTASSRLPSRAAKSVTAAVLRAAPAATVACKQQWQPLVARAAFRRQQRGVGHIALRFLSDFSHFLSHFHSHFSRFSQGGVSSFARSRCEEIICHHHSWSFSGEKM